MTPRTDTALSPDEMVTLIKLQFHMVAQTASEMFALTGSPGPFKVSAQIGDRKIVAIVGIEV